MKKVYILDSTLRDGAQGEGISFSVRDKINIVAALDSLGIDYIEAGNPFSNPKDMEFFRMAKDMRLEHSKLCAFGSTRRRGVKVEADANVVSLLEAATPAVTIFGKAWDFHVTDIIKTSLEENLKMIADTVAYLKDNGKEVIFDAEHFFDGYKANPDYALSALKAAENAGADLLCLCDTNGGTFPDEIASIMRAIDSAIDIPVGIHTHDDGGMAVANSVMAVENGAEHVQGTLIGIGERCGNANLSAIIANLQLKRGYDCIPAEKMRDLTSVCRRIAETANVRLLKSMPYVGKSAFAHKGGMHIDGVSKSPHSFEHVNPETVGNERRFLLSEMSGRTTVLEKINKIDSTVTKDSPVTAAIIDKVKEMEFKGYQFEGADASFELLIRKQLGTYKPFFKLEKFKTIGEQITGNNFAPASALVKVNVDGFTEISGDEGDGPVNALDKALRKALERFYPALSEMHLTDYKVRILDSREATSAVTRVLIETTDGVDTWTTVGVSKDIIDASLIAFVDSIEYKLIKDSNVHTQPTAKQ